jgi:uncharacterized repeat protein (TIGR01451 family)
MRASFHMSGGNTGGKFFLCTNRRSGRFRRRIVTLFCATGLLYPAVAAWGIEINKPCLNNQAGAEITSLCLNKKENPVANADIKGNGILEEPVLLMNPLSERTSIKPLFLLSMRVKVGLVTDPRLYEWKYTRVYLEKVDDPNRGKSNNFCTDSTDITNIKANGSGLAMAFSLFGDDDFSKANRKALESLPSGDYKLSIQAFNTEALCTGNKTSMSELTNINGSLRLKAVQEIVSATVNGAASSWLQPGEKFDLGVVLKNNRPGTDKSARLNRVEWLIATAPPAPTATNHAPGMNCAEPGTTSSGFSGTFSSNSVVTVPAGTAYGTYNLYLRGNGNSSCTASASNDYPISPLFVLKNAITVEPGIRHIKMTPSQPPPQPPVTVGRNDVTVIWEVKFLQPVAGVNTNAFRLISSGVGASGASIVSIMGVGDTYYVTTKVPAGSVAPDQLASLRLDFHDDDSVRTVTGNRPMGGPGQGNGNFTGETYALRGTICGESNVIWCDDFERSVQGAARSNLVGNGWVAASPHSDCESHAPASNAQPDAGGCAGIDSDIKPYHLYANLRANSSRSMFNRWREHTVTSEVIDLSGLSADTVVELSYWLRRGDDDFAEKPDLSTDNFITKYLDRNNQWQILARYRSTNGKGVAGEVLRPVFQLPAEALWSGFRLRFEQAHGSGSTSHSNAGKVNGYDYWFIDDVVLRRVDMPRYVGGFCDNFEAPAASLKQWTFNQEDISTGAGSGLRIGDAGVTGDVYPASGSPNHSLFLRWSYIVASTLRIDTRGLGGNIRYVAQRGMKDPPDTINGADVNKTCIYTTADKEDSFVSEYFGADGKWHTLDSIAGKDSDTRCGEDISYTSAPLSGLPQAQHENFRLRFRQLSYSSGQNGNDHKDYWLVDDVCIGRTDGAFPRADLELTKTRENSLYPGGIGIYVLSVKNNGPDRMRGTLEVVDTLPTEMRFHDFQGTGWFCEAAGQTVTCSWNGDLEKGQRAPDLRIYALVSESASGTLKNKGTLSSGAVDDPAPGNNTDDDEGVIEAIYFAFTKGQCKDGQAIEDMTSEAACSRYRFAGLAGEARSGIYITHVNASGTAAARLSSSASTAMRLEFALRCVDPSRPPPQGAVNATFGAGSPLLLNVCADSGGTPLWNTVNPLSVTFAADEATVSGVYSFFYEDVGRLELLVRVAGDNTRKGGSGVFVRKPAALVLKDVRCADGTPNPAATGAGGTRFCRAGQPFGMTLEAQSVQGNGAPNFGYENVPKGIFLEKRLWLPQDGSAHDPDLALRGVSGFTNGAVTITEQSWPEVGIIAITPRLGDAAADGGMILSDRYLDAGDVLSEKVIVGRFYPSHFQTETGGAGRMECPPGMSCPEGGFFYAGQPFDLTVKACLYGDETCVGRLENYRGDFAATVKLSAWGVRGSNAEADRNPPDAGANGGYLEPVPGKGLSAAVIPGDKFAGGDGFGGLFTGSFRYAHTFKTRPVEPTDVYIRAAEDGRDSVSSRRPAAADRSPEGGIRLARGRLLLSNSFGSEKDALEIPVQVQFWDCFGVDRCDWTASATDTTRIEPDSGLADADKRAALAVSLHPVQGIATMPEVDRLELSGGAGRIVLLSPGGAGSLNVSVNLGDTVEDNACDHAAGAREGAAAKVPWLRAWNGVCAGAQSGEADPSARATFGTYSGERRRSVHSRELY